MTRAAFLLIALAACGDSIPVQRGELGSSDLFGSCSNNSSCGGPSEGSCWCDDACLGYGDCCADKPSVCKTGAKRFATFNAGLAHGAVPYADERIQPIVDALAQSSSDVLCLQEVWTDADAEAIRSGLATAFPHSFREPTPNDVSSVRACDVNPTLTMKGCVDTKCTPTGISAFECAADQCKPEWDALSDDCKVCLSANTDSPTTCALWEAPMYANDGRNGLMLLSRQPFDSVSYHPFETHVIKRGVITAEVDGYNIQCTHMTAALGIIPYPQTGSFRSWREEHAAQVTLMAELAGDRRTVMMGDLNTSPASPGVDPELPDNFTSLEAAGYRDTWSSPTCTYCQENPLVCSKPEGCGGSVRLDHILLKNFPDDIRIKFERTLDGYVPATGRLSDHYGLMGTMPY